MKDIRNFFFKYRGYLPIPLAILVIIQSDISLGLAIPGGALILLGETIRLLGVRAAGGRTRTRKVGAKTLCTWGPYAYVRNPLYIGNFFIYTGMILFAGGKYILLLLLIGVAYIFLQYHLIIKLEEETLERIFREDYIEYRNNVPRVIPRLTPWKGKNDTKKEFLSWSSVLRTERGTLIVLFSFLTAIIVKEIAKGLV